MFSNSQLRGLILPFFLEQLLNMTVGVADTFMVSFAGDAAVSGVSLVNMLAVFFLYVFTALASGGAVVVSQYIGGKNGRGAEHSAGQLLMISTMVSALCSAAILTWNREILQLLFGRVEKSVMQACMTYQRISAYSFAALGIYNAGAAVCRSEGKTSVTLKIAVFSNIVNPDRVPNTSYYR